jgi:3-methyladenine DNA glycosylase Tag
MSSFASIRARAAKRKGGEQALLRLLPRVTPPEQLAELGDDRFLSEMTRRIFCSGFAWTVIDTKWAGFEEAFLGFVPSRLLSQQPAFWDALTSDTRIVRNGQKIASVRKNAQFITDVAAEHGGFGRFLADWPASDHAGLLEVLVKRGSRLGGHTGQYFLRFVGKDGFLVTPSVVLCLREAGLTITDEATSKKDLAAVQRQLNAWAEETGLPYAHLTEICALSVGESCAEGRHQDRM